MMEHTRYLSLDIVLTALKDDEWTEEADRARALLGAAPDLLEALENAHEFLTTGNTSHGMTAMLQEVEEALAKARP